MRKLENIQNNSLSVDLEYWWCNEFIEKYLPEQRADILKESLEPLILLFDKYQTKVTFFVLGLVAENYPDLIDALYNKGHEIAIHGYSHKKLSVLGKHGFEKEIKICQDLMSNYNPVGFRAPSFSLDQKTAWALDILADYGFIYDSSIFPIKTQLYGVPDAPVSVYRPSKYDITQHDPFGKIIEFPLTVINLGKNIPIAGGFYFRIFPSWFLKWGINKVNQTRAAVLYIHPQDVYEQIPKIKVPLIPKFVTYYGIKSAKHKVEDLLVNYKFKPLKELLDGF